MEDHETSEKQQRGVSDVDADVRCRAPGQERPSRTSAVKGGEVHGRVQGCAATAAAAAAAAATEEEEEVDAKRFGNIAGHDSGIRGRQRQSCPEVDGGKGKGRRGG